MLFHIDFLTYFACSFISDEQHNVFIYIYITKHNAVCNFSS